jgi:phenylacetic acid degradation operon negative regulatory protein
LIITVFGDAIAPRGGAISLGSLIRIMSPFGLTERLVRTSVARLADEDWLSSRRVGRLSEYALSAPGRQRFADATARIYAGPASGWSGRWTLVLMPAIDAASRRQIRDSLRWEGFGEPEAGVLAHPALTPEETRSHLHLVGLDRDVLILQSRCATADDDRRMLTAGWDLRELALRYARFIRNFESALPALQGRAPVEPAAAFAIRILLIHEYRKIHLRDPLLPSALLPSDWPGTRAYELCRAIYERVLTAAEEHLTLTAERLDRPLPAPDAALFRRFAGLLPG